MGKPISCGEFTDTSESFGLKAMRLGPRKRNIKKQPWKAFLFQDREGSVLSKLKLSNKGSRKERQGDAMRRRRAGAANLESTRSLSRGLCTNNFALAAYGKSPITRYFCAQQNLWLKMIVLTGAAGVHL